MENSIKVKPDWWHDFFPSFRPIFAAMSQKATNAQVRYIIRKLDLKAGKKFLDCPCGIGRISLPMARKGIRITGVDITGSYLDELGAVAKRRGLRMDLVQADMRRINFDKQFDAAGNLWTSFGYFEKESDNLLVLKKMYRALKPGEKFLLHLINRDWIMANFEPSGWSEVNGIKILEKRGFDSDTSISRSEWIFIKNGQEETHTASIRLYAYHELITMFRKVGFVDIEGYSSTKDEPISRDQRMMFVFGTRPKS